MHHDFKPSSAALLLFSIGAWISPILASAEQTFQVTFGTRLGPGERGMVTDTGQLLVETHGGDLVVAGDGASQYTDTGNHTKPMLARFDRTGELIYQHILEGFDNYRATELRADPGGETLLLVGPSQRLKDGTHSHPELVLLEIDGDGRTTRSSARRVDVLDPWAAVRGNDDPLVDLLLAAIPRGLTETQARAVLRRQYAFDGQGRWQRRSGATSASHPAMAQVTATGELVFLQAYSKAALPKGVKKIDRQGRLTTLIAFDEEQSRSRVALTTTRIFLVSSPARGRESTVSAYSIDGDLLWRQRIGPIDGQGRPLPLRDDGLLVTGSYEDVSVLIRLDSAGGIAWYERVRSTKRLASLERALELRDGSIAFTGSTSGFLGGFSSTDHDAFLVVTDADAQGLSAYQACLAEASTVESLRLQLEAMTGLRAERRSVYSRHAAASDSPEPALGEPVRLGAQCPPVSEAHFVAFLEGALASAQALAIARPDEKTMVSVTVLPQRVFAEEPRGMREVSAGPSGRVPRIEAGHLSATDTVTYFREEVVPFLLPMRKAIGELEQELGWRWYVSRHYSVARGVPSFRQQFEALSATLTAFRQLDGVSRTALRGRYPEHIFSIARGPEVLHLWGRDRVIVGRDRLAHLFPYLLEELPALRERIEQMSSALLSELNVRIARSDPDILHVDYLEALEALMASAAQLSDEERVQVRSLAVAIDVSASQREPVGMRCRRREIAMQLDASGALLPFVLTNREVLAAQEPRRE
ncbi:MAG: hypothetical protein AAGA68_22840 [Pseudomonadota bacterium]